MAGPRPGHPRKRDSAKRLMTAQTRLVVDARDKPEHDGLEMVICRLSKLQRPRLFSRFDGEY
jgi:hypothetical protein